MAAKFDFKKNTRSCTSPKPPGTVDVEKCLYCCGRRGDPNTPPHQEEETLYGLSIPSK